MGMNQLLLSVLGMVIVGIAIVVAITMFQSNAIEASRSSIINDLMFFAGRAREYYRKPFTMGGANKDFSNITIQMLSAKTENENARYYVESSSPDELVIVGVGKIVAGDDSIRIRMRINEKKSSIEIIN